MNAREQRLAIALVAILLLGGGWIAFTKMMTWKKDLEEREHQLSLRRIEFEELIKTKPFWTARSEWLESKQPVWTSQRAADDELNKLISESSKKEGVTVLASLQQEPIQQDGLWASGISLEVKGPYDKTLQWLNRLQSPEGHPTYDAFVSIKGLALKPDPEDGTKIHIQDLHIQKWYRESTEPTPAAPPAGKP
jgi:hypothetical protein